MPRSFRIYCAIAVVSLVAWHASRASEQVTRADAVEGDAPAPAAKSAQVDAKFTTETLRGRVVFLGEALKRRFGINTVREATDRQLALETSDGTLHPLVEDIRGRAFRVDERLRKFDVELFVRRYEGSPVVQIINVFAVLPSGKVELDYWCEICAIAMYELKACDCCQGDIELRMRPVNESSK